LRFICCEELDGRRWNYVAETDSDGKFKNNSFRSLSLQTPKPPIDVCCSYIPISFSLSIYLSIYLVRSSLTLVCLFVCQRRS
jgi:hypothetical protein